MSVDKRKKLYIMKRLVINTAELQEKFPEDYDFLLTKLKQFVAEDRATWNEVEEFENGNWLAELSLDEDESKLIMKASANEQGLVQQSPWGEDDIEEVSQETIEMLKDE